MAPAMNTQMFEHLAVRRNLDVLAERGVRFVEPGEGYLACGWIGKGRLAEPEDIVAAADAILRPPSTLTGRRVLVTAGPTYEDLDPVRYIGNRSSGRMGFAAAEEAVRRGAVVTLVSGPTTVTPPSGCEVVRVRSAAEEYISRRIPRSLSPIMSTLIRALMRPSVPSPAQRAARWRLP